METCPLQIFELASGRDVFHGRRGQYWRTDIPFSVLNDPWVRTARYILEDGPIVDSPLPDLRGALKNAPTRQHGSTVGPYNIDPFAKTNRWHSGPNVYQPYDRSRP